MDTKASVLRTQPLRGPLTPERTPFRGAACGRGREEGRKLATVCLEQEGSKEVLFALFFKSSHYRAAEGN